MASANSTGKGKRSPTELRTILFFIIATFLTNGCEWFGPAEKYKTDSGRTVFRSAEEPESDTATSASQKIPGESKKN